jgi:hypothetical protein
MSFSPSNEGLNVFIFQMSMVSALHHIDEVEPNNIFTCIRFKQA